MVATKPIEIVNIMTALLEDAAMAFPAERADFERDQARITRMVRERGEMALVADLPALAKHLDRCLAEGVYKPPHLPLARPVNKRVQIPRFLRGLYLHIFEPETGLLKEDCNVEALLFLRQVLLAFKKLDRACSVDAVAAEVAAFVATEAQLPQPSEIWRADAVSDSELREVYKGGFAAYPTATPETGRVSTLLKVMDIVSSHLVAALGSYDPLEWPHRHGPGATAEAARNATYKYAFERWSRQLEAVFPSCDHAFHNWRAWMDRHWSLVDTYVDHDGNVQVPQSRLIAVPKTIKKPRLIAAEPVEHVWCQQSIRDYMYERSSASFINLFVRFRDQTLNQALARKGSLDGSLATVDLSSASDRVTCECVGAMFRDNPGLLRALWSCRTRRLRISTDLSGLPEQELDLKKFSTMGSAVTFPVETLIFLSCALSATILSSRGFYWDSRSQVSLGDILDLQGQVGVFGDDIIVPTHAVAALFELLEALHFKVNADKSFWTGMFREACGLDAFRGVDVSPVYVRRSLNLRKPETLASWVDTSNRFHDRFLLATTRLYDRATAGIGVQLKHWESGVFGLSCFTSPFSALSSKTKWNRWLQRREVRAACVRTRAVKTQAEGDAALLQFFTERAEGPARIGDPFVAGWCERAVLKIQHSWVDIHDLAECQSDPMSKDHGPSYLRGN